MTKIEVFENDASKKKVNFMFMDVCFFKKCYSADLELKVAHQQPWSLQLFYTIDDIQALKNWGSVVFA